MRRRRNRQESSSFTDSVKEYLNLKVEYYQLLFTEKMSLLVGKATLLFILSTIFLAVLLLILVLVYNLLMLWIGIPWIVTLIEIGILLLLLGTVLIFRNELIIKPIANSIVRMLLDPDDDNEEEEE